MEVLRCDHCNNDIEDASDHWVVKLETPFQRFDSFYGERHLHVGCLSPWSLKQEISIEEGS